MEEWPVKIFEMTSQEVESQDLLILVLCLRFCQSVGWFPRVFMPVPIFFSFHLEKRDWETKKERKKEKSKIVFLIIQRSSIQFRPFGRLNWLVSLVTEFEESSHLTCPFWSRYNVNRGIRIFHGQDLRRPNLVFHSSAVSTWGLAHLYSRYEKNKRFPPFCSMDFSICSLNACDSCIAKGGNSFSYSYCVLLNVLY